MWIFTKDGFFSAVKDRYCGEGEIMVRGRVRRDLVRLASSCKQAPEIIETPDADYAFRIKLAHEVWTDYVTRAAAGIDYPNVKNAIAGQGARHDAYYDCWSALCRLQRTVPE